MTRSAKGIALLALLAALISFAKFQPCRASGWVAPDVYVKMCYSDLSALYGAREINVDKWPYSSPENSVEYPVITGLVMWATGLLISDPNGYRGYFDINALLIALLFIASALALWRIRPEFAYLLPAAPAVVASLYINWDLWAIAGALVAIYFFKRERYSFSALALGVAIATKFFPIVLLLGVLLHFLHRRDLRALTNYFVITGGSWLAINLPFALTNFAGWFRFYKLNLERGPDLGSLWYGIELLGRSSANSNFATIILLALGILGIAYTYNRSDGRQWRNDRRAAGLASPFLLLRSCRRATPDAGLRKERSCKTRQTPRHLPSVPAFARACITKAASLAARRRSGCWPSGMPWPCWW